MFNIFHLNGIEAFNKQDYEAAKNLFLQAVDKNPEVAESYFFLGKSYFFCNEKKDAVAHLKKYIEFNQHNLKEAANVSYAFDLLGQCYEANNEDSMAITCYSTASKINPAAASAWHNLGLLYIKSAQYYLEKNHPNTLKLFQGALAFLKKALEISATNPMFLNSVASCHEKYIAALEKTTEDQKNIDTNFKLAIQHYQQALTACRADDIGLKNIITSNLTECLAQYGHHLYQADDFVKAIELYLQALTLDPDHLAVLNQIGMSLFKQNHFSEARSYFSDILGKTSAPQELADAWLNIACTHRLEKSWADAENALSEAKKFVPEDPSIFDEEKKLVNAKAQASLIAAPQIMFRNTNTVPQPPLITKTAEDPLQFN